MYDREDPVFAWDGRKARANLAKHGIDFEEAASVFLDANALLIADPANSEGEERFLLLGSSARFRLLVISHCYRENARVIRIISARKAARQEARQYLDQARPGKGPG